MLDSGQTSQTEVTGEHNFQASFFPKERFGPGPFAGARPAVALRGGAAAMQRPRAAGEFDQ